MVSVANAGNSSLSLTDIAATGDFSETNSCGSTLAIGATCTFSVMFTPTLPGSRTGSLTITDDNNGIGGSVQTVALAGTGIGPLVSLSVSGLALGTEIAGTASAAQTIKLTNTGNASLAISSIAVSGANAGDFAETNTCGSSVAAGAACTISVTFTPNRLLKKSKNSIDNIS